VYNATTRRPRGGASYYLRPTTAYILTAIMYTCVYIYYYVLYGNSRLPCIYDSALADTVRFVYIILLYNNIMCAPGGVLFFPARPPLFETLTMQISTNKLSSLVQTVDNEICTYICIHKYNYEVV